MAKTLATNRIQNNVIKKTALNQGKIHGIASLLPILGQVSRRIESFNARKTRCISTQEFIWLMVSLGVDEHHFMSDQNYLCLEPLIFKMCDAELRHASDHFQLF